MLKRTTIIALTSIIYMVTSCASQEKSNNSKMIYKNPTVTKKISKKQIPNQK